MIITESQKQIQKTELQRLINACIADKKGPLYFENSFVKKQYNNINHLQLSAYVYAVEKYWQSKGQTVIFTRPDALTYVGIERGAVINPTAVTDFKKIKEWIARNWWWIAIVGTVMWCVIIFKTTNKKPFGPTNPVLPPPNFNPYDYMQ